MEKDPVNLSFKDDGFRQFETDLLCSGGCKPALSAWSLIGERIKSNRFVISSTRENVVGVVNFGNWLDKVAWFMGILAFGFDTMLNERVNGFEWLQNLGWVLSVDAFCVDKIHKSSDDKVGT